MKVKDNLFELIKSLQPTEKRFFKVYASRHVIGEKNNYVKLFEAIDKQESYDEEKIIKRFKDQRFVKHLAAEKYYLYNFLLECLAAYHAGVSVENRLRTLLNHSEILAEKSLFYQSLKILSKAKKLAQETERFVELYDILGRERALLQKQVIQKTKNIDQQLEETYHEQTALLEKEKNKNAYYMLYDKIYAHYKKSGALREMDSQLKILIRDPLFQDEGKALSFDAKRYFFGAHIIYHFITGDTEKNYFYSHELVKHIESNPIMKEHKLFSYIAALHSLLITCVQLNKEKEIEDIRRKLKEIGTSPVLSRSKDMRARFFENYYAQELDLILKRKNYTEGVDLILEIEEYLKNHGEEISATYMVTIYYNIVAIYFNLSMYNKALHWINRLLNEKRGELREDLVCYIKAVTLIIHYELGNVVMLPYFLKSTYHYLSKKKRIYKFESILFNYIRQLLALKNADKTLAIFKELKDEFVPLLKDPFEHDLFNDIDIIAWLDKQVTGKTKGRKAINS